MDWTPDGCPGSDHARDPPAMLIIGLQHAKVGVLKITRCIREIGGDQHILIPEIQSAQDQHPLGIPAFYNDLPAFQLINIRGRWFDRFSKRKRNICTLCTGSSDRSPRSANVHG